MTEMIAKVKRKIVKIDEEKCNGCGVCVPACAEGAIQIIGGKAKLISERYCDGLGACLGECPQGAISIEEREAEGFDEEAVEHYLAHMQDEKAEIPCGCPSSTVTQFEKAEPCGCASAAVSQFEKHVSPDDVSQGISRRQSMLGHWPVQLTLVPPTAPFLQRADLVLVADCVPFAYPDIHRDFLRDHAVLVACPKLDDFDAHLVKLTQILREAEVKSLTVVHMEVPCCSRLVHMAKQAISSSGKIVPLADVTIGIRGEIKS